MDTNNSSKGNDAFSAVNDAVSQSRAYRMPSRPTVTDEDFTTNSSVYKVAQEETAPSIPIAIQPVTYEKCCKIALANPRTHDASCRNTCFSKHACENKLYPYSSEEEMKFLYQSRKWKKKEFRRPWIDECVRMMTENPPQPTTWCQDTQTQRRQQKMNLTNIPLGCSMVMGMDGMSGPFDRTILFPADKLGT